MEQLSAVAAAFSSTQPKLQGMLAKAILPAPVANEAQVLLATIAAALARLSELSDETAATHAPIDSPGRPNPSRPISPCRVSLAERLFSANTLEERDVEELETSFGPIWDEEVDEEVDEEGEDEEEEGEKKGGGS